MGVVFFNSYEASETTPVCTLTHTLAAADTQAQVNALPATMALLPGEYTYMVVDGTVREIIKVTAIDGTGLVWDIQHPEEMTTSPGTPHPIGTGLFFIVSAAGLNEFGGASAAAAGLSYITEADETADLPNSSQLSSHALSELDPQAGRLLISEDWGHNSSGVYNPSTITGNVNDYSPGAIGTASVLRITSTVDFDMTGLAAPSTPFERRIVLFMGSTHTMTLKANSVLSAAANRFGIPADLKLTLGEQVELLYDSSLLVWCVIGKGVTAHGDLTGLANNDHPQYELAASLAPVAESGILIDLTTTETDTSLVPHPNGTGGVAWGAGGGGGGGGSGGEGVIGTAVFSATGGAISGASYGGVISSVTRTGAGLFTVNFSPTQTNPYTIAITCSSDLTDVMTTYINATSIGSSGFDFTTVTLTTGPAGRDPGVVTVTIMQVSVPPTLQEAFPSANVVTSGSMSWSLVCSLSLSAGDWEVGAIATISGSSNGTGAFALSDGSSTTYAVTHLFNGDGNTHIAVVSKKITLTSTTTVGFYVMHDVAALTVYKEQATAGYLGPYGAGPTPLTVLHARPA